MTNHELTNHELNVKAGKLKGLIHLDHFDGWSPATSIEDAMGLMDILSGGDELGDSFVLSNTTIEVWGKDEDAHLKAYSKPDERPRAITEAFIAAMEASKIETEKIDQLSTRIRNGEIDPEEATK